uniref:LOW QUALITY PROTEIN: beta-defensin 126 n=1 Tax=Callithrix jacchus TaxID=9483 RepID=UPI0023DD3772|nr:LOW QUALITY PROTEIN: beta-defensin 126 [Callithrix jacchus]
MKSLLFTLAVFMLLAQLVSGNWFMKKCANKAGLCKKKCKPGEVYAKPAWVTCGKESCAVFQVKHVLVTPLSVWRKRLRDVQQQQQEEV